jgi:membrane-associated phospholipid phosphatase
VSSRNRCELVGLAAFVGFFVLGRVIGASGEPSELLAWERGLVGHSTLVAWWLTESCYPVVLVPIALALLILAWRAPAWRARALLSVAMLLLCWRGADFFQHFFARPRRLDWAVKHETSFSYPSSHAAIAIGFYGLGAVMLYLSDLPKVVRRAGAVLIGLFAVAICWARLALGAHYVTDLIGGALLALAFVSAGLAVVPGVLTPKVVAGRASTPAE